MAQAVRRGGAPLARCVAARSAGRPALLSAIRAALRRARRPRLAGLALAGVVLVAAAARLYRLDTTWYFLEQVDTLTAAVGIAEGRRFPLLGLPIGWTSAHTGPLYFYLMAIPFLVSRDPIAGAVFVALLNLAAIVVAYRFARLVVGERLALVAALLMAVFPPAVASSRVMWNPGPLPLFTGALMWALHSLIVRGRSAGIVGVAASLAVSTQLHASAFALVGVAVVASAVFRPRIAPRHAALATAVALGLYAPYLVHELRHGFTNTRGFLLGLAGGSGEPGPLALPSVVASLLTMHVSVLGGLGAVGPPPAVLQAGVVVAHGLEAALVAFGVAVAALALARRERGREAVIAPRSAALLLIWLIVPVLLVGIRRTAVWWYYLDVLYPCPFVLAALALRRLGAFAGEPGRRTAVVTGIASGCLVVAATAQLAWHGWAQRAIAARGQIVLDTDKLSIGAAGSPLGRLRSLPYGQRRALVRALVLELGVDRAAFSSRVHGATLGVLQENAHLLDLLARGGAGRAAPPAPDTRIAVVEAAGVPDARQVVRARRVGPHVVAEYRPSIDYERWSAAVASRAGVPASADWRAARLPVSDPVFALTPESTLWLQGPVRAASPVRISVSVIADRPVAIAGQSWASAPVTTAAQPAAGAPLAVAGEAGAPLAVTSGSGFTPSLYWVTEALVDLPAAASPAGMTVRLSIAGAARIRRLDVHEVGPGAQPWATRSDTAATGADRT